MPTHEELFQETRMLKESILLGADMMGCGSCLYWTLCGYIVLTKYGLKPIIQGGSASFLLIKSMKEDDGKMCTHLSYQWDPDNKLSMFAEALGALPEMHSWLGIVKTQELIDFSTGEQKEQARRLGLKWAAPNPPPFIWCSPAVHFPEGWRYEANRDATVYIHNLLRFGQNEPIQRLVKYAIEQRII